MTVEDARREIARLRRFGFVMSVPLAGLGALLWWRSRPAAPWLFGLAAAFLLAGAVAPRALGPIERAWMAFAAVLQKVMTTVILTVTYFVVMTPLGLVMRALGKEPLGKRPDRELETYWVPVEPDGPGSRPDKPY